MILTRRAHRILATVFIVAAAEVGVLGSFGAIIHHAAAECERAVTYVSTYPGVPPHYRYSPCEMNADLNTASFAPVYESRYPAVDGLQIMTEVR